MQKFGYALFFMNDNALAYLDKSEGWEIGVGPSIVVVDKGVGKSLTSTTLTQDVYAFIFDQKGLMAGIGIQGSKITKIPIARGAGRERSQDHVEDAHLARRASLIVGVSAPALRAEQPAPAAAAEANLEVLLDAIRSNRKALVAANLRLTDEEAAKFWPVYDRYQKEINADGDRGSR